MMFFHGFDIDYSTGIWYNDDETERFYKGDDIMPKLTIVFPSSYFSIHKVDEDLQAEYDVVIDTGLFDVVLFSYDKWFNEGVLVLDNEPEDFVRGAYRGWMMKPELYKRFYEQLADRKIRLVTDPAEYERFHIFPNVFRCFGEDTAKMLIYPDGSVDLDEVKRSFKRFMVKDYVKSVKGTDFPKFFESDVSQEEFDRQMEKFYKYRSSLYTGGICIKEYLELKHYGSRTNEWRVFYIDGEPASVSANSGQCSYSPMPPKELIEKYGSLGSPFYTVDYAELTDGSWKVIEAGDGQVSGLSDNQDYNAFFRSLSIALSETYLPDELPPPGTYIMCGDPYPDIEIEDVYEMVSGTDDEKTIALAVAILNNKTGIIADELDDYETDSDEYRRLDKQYDSAYDLYKKLTDKIIDILTDKGELPDTKGIHFLIEPFMNRNGFINGNGWWVHQDEEK